MVGSGDQLDQSQDSEERKGSGYNLRSMFKDVRPPSGSTNGVAPTAGKRRKSLTIFGLRRGSDPVSVRAGEGTGRETAGVRFAIPQQPAVLEELSQGENLGVLSAGGTKAGTKPVTEQLKNHRAASGDEAKASGQVPPSSQGKNQDSESRAAPEGGATLVNFEIQPSAVSTAGSAAPPSVPGQTVRTAQKPRELEVKLLGAEDGYDPGPLQTSTPIAPVYGSSIPADQAEPCPSTDHPVTQTPSDRSLSPDPESGVGVNPNLISLGSSPPSSQPIRTHSSASSLKTPTSPFPNTPSPKLGSRTTLSEASKTGFSPPLTPSPKLPSGRPSSSFGLSAGPSQAQTPSSDFICGPKLGTMAVSPQTPSSCVDHDPSFEYSPRLTKKEASSSSFPDEEGEPGGATIQSTEEKKEIKRPGILKKPKPSPVVGVSKEIAPSSHSEQLSEDRPASLLLSPSSPLSPASPRVGSVTIVKASPDSKREFSVITMVEKEEACTSTKDQEGETCGREGQSEKLGLSSVMDRGGEVSVPGVGEQSRGTPGAEPQPTVVPERDDMVEMEDIRDCKVTQKK